MTFLEWLKSWFGPKKPPAPVPAPVDGMLALHNAERLRHHVPILTADSRLASAAQSQAETMAAAGARSHAGLAERVTAVGYRWTKIAENAVCGTRMDAHLAWQWWCSSPEHYANAVDSELRDVGFGSAVSSLDGQTYWCAIYGREGET